MKLLADENFPSPLVDALREAGYDILGAQTAMSGADDDEILKRAESEQRLLLTFDKDFGNLAFRWGLPSTCGIVLFRLKMHSPEYLKDHVLGAFENCANWIGKFVVIEEFRTRIREIPAKVKE